VRRNASQNIGIRGQGPNAGNPRLILDGRQLGFAAKLQSDFFDRSRFCQVEDDLPREKGWSHLGSGAFEGKDIRVYEDFNASMFVVPPGRRVLAIDVVGMVGSALKNTM
jgi:hypothetical protein